MSRSGRACLVLGTIMGCLSGENRRATPEAEPVGLAITRVTLAEDTVVIYRWYPAVGAGARLSVGDYISGPTCADSGRSPEGHAAWLEASLGGTVSRPALDSILGTPTIAVRDLREATPRGRVLILSALRAEPWFHAPLAERLARVGLETLAWRICGSPASGFDSAGVVRETARARRLLRWAADRNPRPVPVGLVAWSFGGAPAVRLTQYEPIAGVVSLDGAIGYRYGEELLRRVGFAPAELRVPLLHLAAGVESAVERSSWVVDATSAPPAIRATVPGVTHAGFTAPYGVWSPVPDRPPVGQPGEVDSVVARWLSVVLRGGSPPAEFPAHWSVPAPPR